MAPMLLRSFPVHRHVAQQIRTGNVERIYPHRERSATDPYRRCCASTRLCSGNVKVFCGYPSFQSQRVHLLMGVVGHGVLFCDKRVHGLRLVAHAAVPRAPLWVPAGLVRTKYNRAYRGPSESTVSRRSSHCFQCYIVSALLLHADVESV